MKDKMHKMPDGSMMKGEKHGDVEGYKHGGKVHGGKSKKSSGGNCRGMGAATKGGKFVGVR